MSLLAGRISRLGLLPLIPLRRRIFNTVGAARPILAVLYLLFSRNNAQNNSQVQSNSQVQACIDRGVAYFREIDAYPNLSDGRDAVTVARERCNRTTTAFP